MSLDTLQALFEHELKDIYHGEKQLLDALPRMAEAATSPELQKAITNHLSETEGHVRRLEKILKQQGMPERGKRCKGMEGLVEEGKDIMKEEAEPSVMDAALIAAAQKVEHYEIAAYGCLRTYAELLGHSDAEKLLAQTLQEEEAADQKLTEIGEGGVNANAAAVAAETAR